MFKRVAALLKRRPAERRRGGAQVRRVDQVMELVGILLIPAGITAVLLGWYGAASTGLVFEQMPYLISGGLLGVGLLFAAGCIYLASWISRSAEVQRRQNDQLIEQIAQLRRDLAAAPLPASAAADSVGAAANGAGPALLATPNGSMFHRPDCAIVSGRQDVRPVTADEAGMKPCGMCNPLGADATAN